MCSYISYDTMLRTAVLLMMEVIVVVEVITVLAAPPSAAAAAAVIHVLVIKDYSHKVEFNINPVIVQQSYTVQIYR